MVIKELHPLRHLSSTQVSVSTASRMLERYLENASQHPHLHPDAVVTSVGVQFFAHSGALGGTVIHNLRRFAAGFRGEYLELEGIAESEDEGESSMGKFGNGKTGRKKIKVEKDDDWQELAEYEREQGGTEVGEVGSPTNVVQNGGEEPEVKVTEDVHESPKKRKREAEQDEHGDKPNKEARKAAKKERKKEEKREREMARAKKAD